MNDLDVRIVRLEPMRVATALGFGESPEAQAWEMILAYAAAKGLDPSAQRFFGFNNPNPSHGSPHYGYEQWVTAGAGLDGEDGVQIKEFDGGLYAVTRCEGVESLPATWQRLVLWCEDSRYHQAHHQWLEECLTPPGLPPEAMVFDLYLPIAV